MLRLLSILLLSQWLPETKAAVLYYLEKYDSADTPTGFSIPDFHNTYNQTLAMWIYCKLPKHGNNRQNPIAFGYAGEGTITLEPGRYASYFWGPVGGNRSPYQHFATGGNFWNWATWTHIAVTRDLRNRKLTWYKDGVYQNSASTTANFNDTVGRQISSGGNVAPAKTIGTGYTNHYHGEIKELYVYDEVRTPAQILELAQAIVPGYVDDTIRTYGHFVGCVTHPDDNYFNHGYANCKDYLSP